MAASSQLLLPYRLARYGWRTWRDALPVARRRDISVFQIISEQIALKRANGLRPDEYYFYGLDDPAIPWEEKLTYLGTDRLRDLWFILTPQRCHHLFWNKLTFKRYFGGMGFPVAKFYGVYDPIWGQTADGAPLRNAVDLAAWMTANPHAQGTVFKPLESAEGRMVLVFSGRKKSDPNSFVNLRGEAFSPDDIVRFYNNPDRLKEAYPETPFADAPRTAMVEERLHMHPALREFAPHTLCCVRIVTLTTRDGRVEILETALKLQDNDSGVDNVIQGSLAIGVDPQTGVLRTGLYKEDMSWERRRRLPGMDRDFTGVQLPDWQESVDLARRAARAFPEAHTVGWDVALTDRGPMIVEGNASWGNFQAECQEGLMKGAFKELVEHLTGLKTKSLIAERGLQNDGRILQA